MITMTMVSTRPAGAKGASAISPTASAKAPCSAASTPTRARPCARLAQAKLEILASAGAPLTSATAKSTQWGATRPAKPFFTSTATVPPSTSPLAKPSSVQGHSSRAYIASTSELGRAAAPPVPVLCGASAKFSAYQRVQGAQPLRVGALRPAGAILQVPGIEIEVQPVGGGGHEALQEQRRNNGPGKSTGGDIVEVRDPAGQLLVVARPQGHGPERIRDAVPRFLRLAGQCRATGKQRRQIRSEGRAGRARQRRQVDQQIRTLGVGVRERIGQHQSPFSIGVADLA